METVRRRLEGAIGTRFKNWDALTTVQRKAVLDDFESLLVDELKGDPYDNESLLGAARVYQDRIGRGNIVSYAKVLGPSANKVAGWTEEDTAKFLAEVCRAY